MSRFKAGVSGNSAGRPRGSVGGRMLALRSLDKLLSRRKNQEALIAALEAELAENPVRFFKTIVMPLLPTSAKVSVAPTGLVQWKSLVGISGAAAPAPAAAVEPGGG